MLCYVVGGHTLTIMALVSANMSIKVTAWAQSFLEFSCSLWLACLLLSQCVASYKRQIICFHHWSIMYYNKIDYVDKKCQKHCMKCFWNHSWHNLLVNSSTMRSHDHALCLLTQNFAYLHSWFFSFKRFHLLLRAAFACCTHCCVCVVSSRHGSFLFRDSTIIDFQKKRECILGQRSGKEGRG